MALLFARSLRAFGGSLRHSPVHTIAPRAGKDLSAQMRAKLREAGVHHEHRVLNSRFDHYPIANKVFVSAWVEETCESDVLVFVDSDVLVVSEPGLLTLADGSDVAVRPVDVRGAGVRDERDVEYAYWKRLYEMVDVFPASRVETFLDRERILPYWNAGLVAARRDLGLFASWKRTFEQSLARGIVPAGGLTFVDQTTLAATIVSRGLSVLAVPNAYSYPIHVQERIRASDRIERLEDLVTVHYHGVFDRMARANPFWRLLGEDAHSAWIRRELDATGVYPANPLRRTLHVGARFRDATVRRAVRRWRSLRAAGREAV